MLNYTSLEFIIIKMRKRLQLCPLCLLGLCFNVDEFWSKNGRFLYSTSVVKFAVEGDLVAN